MTEPQWRGQIVLDIDIEAEDDDKAMEALTDFVSPILDERCSIAERRIVLRHFFGRPDAPWQKATMATNAEHLIDIALEIAAFTAESSEFYPQTDLHIHRQSLEDSIDSALRTTYREGMRAQKAKYRPDLQEAIQEAESPPRVASLLRDFAAQYDKRGWTDEANLLRDAATQVEDVPSDLHEKEPA